MGSFNITCCVSGLPIVWGDDIVAIPLIKKEVDFDPVEYPVWSHYFYEICGLPLYGKYKDYGQIEVDESTSDDLACKIYKKINENSVWGDTYSFFVCHKSAYEYLLNLEWTSCGGDSFLYDRFFGINDEKYNSIYSSVIENCMEFTMVDCSDLLNMNKGFVQYYFSNPFNFDDEDATDNFKFQLKYYKQCLPVVEASMVLNYKIEPPMYENQTADVVDVVKCKNDIFKSVVEYKEKNGDFE